MLHYWRCPACGTRLSDKKLISLGNLRLLFDVLIYNTLTLTQGLQALRLDPAEYNLTYVATCLADYGISRCLECRQWRHMQSFEPRCDECEQACRMRMRSTSVLQ